MNTIQSAVHKLLGITSVRAVRGAITVPFDHPDQIGAAVTELVGTLVERNRLESGEVVSAIFTATADLTSEFPAVAARQCGWERVPLLCTVEIPVVDGMPRCIRLLAHVERCWAVGEPVHVYLGEAAVLRPDLMALQAPSGVALS